ncbi:MAG: YqeG family HAD IIIA-type phosphatase [Clostridia bacterium]|nr:YqeG family HAD IIIA-type phosphatase [Clostridia bacterium]
MLLEPKLYIENVTKLNLEVLNKNKVKGLILDVDNTLIDYDRNPIEGLEKWCEDLKKNDIKLCILSNSNKKEKVKNLAKKLNIPFIYFAKKPLKTGFKKAKKILDLKNENIGVVGDQLATDVLGANRCKMFSILVKPISEKDIWITKLKRPLENFIIRKYIEKNK